MKVYLLITETPLEFQGFLGYFCKSKISGGCHFSSPLTLQIASHLQETVQTLSTYLANTTCPTLTFPCESTHPTHPTPQASSKSLLHCYGEDNHIHQHACNSRSHTLYLVVQGKCSCLSVQLQFWQRDGRQASVLTARPAQQKPLRVNKGIVP